MADLGRARWRKSSYTGGESNTCVEVAFAGLAVGMRDSKNPTGPTLIFAPAAFGAFIDTVKAGRLDG